MTRYFTKDHDWIEVAGDTGTVGITNYAQGQLGDVVFVQLPGAGATVTKGDEAAVVESVKAASEVNSPVSGLVTEVNAALESDPALVNSGPEGVAWLYRLTLSAPDELAGLMDEAAYNTFVAGL